MTSSIIEQQYCLLDALRKNLSSERYYIKEEYVRQYHDILQRLEDGMGVELKDFKVPDQALTRNISSTNSLSGEVKYRSYREVETSLFFSKMDALLSYFSIVIQEPPVEVGFKNQH